MKKLLAVFSFVLAILFTACSSAPQVETGASVYNPYPEIKAPATMAVYDATPQMLISEGASYARGTVKEILPPVSNNEYQENFDLILEKNPDAKLPDVTTYHFIFAVEETIAGDPLPDEILIVTILESLFPSDMQAGDPFIIAVGALDDGSYHLAHTVQSFYYISEEDRVYPAGRMDRYLQYTGMTVEMFTEAIHS